MEGTERTHFFGYADCVRLYNEHTSVVLGHQGGGRVLQYAHDGENALYLEAGQEGWTYRPGEPAVNPTGGRFDIGPEHIIPRRSTLWLGPWNVEVTGPRAARMTSQPDASTGTQLIRDFTLAPSSAHLRCAQTIVNVSDGTTHWCHWSRTFAKGGGICLIPLTPGSRFPKDYIMYGPGPVMNFRPEDPNIRRRGDFVEILGTPQQPKLGFDSYRGWFAYLTPNNLLFIKRYPTYPERVYNEMAALTISIWYFKNEKCELEPIGPRESLAPGESATFAEEWWLMPYQFPAPGEDVDLEEVTRLVEGMG
jgi:hypothetical protein